MKTKRYLSTALIILLLSPIGISAEEYILTSIKINGLSRTRYSTVLSIIDLDTGSSVNEKTPEETKQKLLESGIFRNEITVQQNISETEAELVINLEDRWTLLPIPAGFVSSEKWLAGAVLIESNLAGLNQVLVAGGFATGDNFTGFLSWNVPAVLGTGYSAGLGLSGFNGLKNHLSVTGDDVLASSEQTMISSRFQLGRSYSSGFKWEGSTGLMSFRTDSGTGYLDEDPYSTIFWQNSITLSWDKLFYISFFNEGPAISLKNTVYSNFDDGVIEPVLELDLSHRFLIADRHLFMGGVSSGWQSRTDFNPLFIGGDEGSRALPSGDIAAESYISGLVAFEPALFTPEWGAFTFPVYYEAGIYNPVDQKEQVFWHGPGFGFRFYVDKVAIPALGADFTWNLEENTFNVVVSVGGRGGE